MRALSRGCARSSTATARSTRWVADTRGSSPSSCWSAVERHKRSEVEHLGAHAFTLEHVGSECRLVDHLAEAHDVTSLPSRTTAASPNGTV
jgi:hypothetical protein